ncbi:MULTISPECIES: NAD(P)-dependent oxidoreductase [unclassified Bradyrhizobium]|uniref:NAD-dependent epimerase/dehydratase family protein n=1 Tax=unclassified Bradyrhizobium TaxID=2631580 RepID=UPI0029169538|nr:MULTISPECIES: NAD(P)-dependent oxidoreductase [unclassified Bradyrhizobium]
MKVLITGGSGFIGSHYADAFVELNNDVTVFDSSPRKHEFRSKYVAGDILDRNAVDEAVRNNDIVIHAAGVLGTHETVFCSEETVNANIIGALNVIRAVGQYGNNLIQISKPNVWLNPYSITKDCVEKFCFMHVNEFDSNIVILKLYNVYGPRQKYSHVRKAIPTWIVDALNRRPIDIYGTGAAGVDLVSTKDVCDGTVAVVNHFDRCKLQKGRAISDNVCSLFPHYNEQILELGSGKEVTVGYAAKILSGLMDLPAQIRHLPMRRGEVDGTNLCADISRLTAITGYVPRVNIVDGFRQTIRYYKDNLSRIENGEL